MVGEQLSQEQTDEIKKLVHAVMEKIRTGEAPAEIIDLYQNIGPEPFGYWLHSFFSGYLGRKMLSHSELFKFLKQESEED